MDFSKTEILEIARQIFNNGRLVHERLLKSQAEYFRNCNAGDFVELSPAQHRCLLTVRRKGQMSITELSAQLGVSPPSASAMVDRLVEKGAFVRRQSASDRRKVMVDLTPRARKIVDGVEEQMLKAFVELVEGIGPEASARWCEVLEKIRSFLELDSTGN